MNKTLADFLGLEALRYRRPTMFQLLKRGTIVLVAVVIPIMLSATGRADSTYSATLKASLTVSEFLDAERNPISKPAGLTLFNVNTFFDDSFVFIEGDATADADAAIDVVADDPFDLVAGDRFDFDLAAFGTTVYPTGFSYASSAGIVQIIAENTSPDPVTISFEFDYDYALGTSVDDPELEYAYAWVEYQLGLEISFPEGSDDSFGLDAFVENNASRADAGAESFEVTLLAGQSEIITALGFVGGDPSGTVPEPASWLLGALGIAILSGANCRRRAQPSREDFRGGRQ